MNVQTKNLISEIHNISQKRGLGKALRDREDHGQLQVHVWLKGSDASWDLQRKRTDRLYQGDLIWELTQADMTAGRSTMGYLQAKDLRRPAL